jgi:hypothetical protein
MFNEADFIISILNSENEKVKDNVNEMCKLSSSDLQTDLNYEIFNNQVKNKTFINESVIVLITYLF